LARGSLFNIITKIIQPHLSQQKIKKFILEQYQFMAEKVEKENKDKDIFHQLTWLLAQLGWVSSISQPAETQQYSSEDYKLAETWFEGLYGAPVINKGVLVAGAGKHLDILDEKEAQIKFVRQQAEYLLRHIESRRRKSMQRFAEPLNGQAMLEEKIAMAIFFSCYARRHEDLRFLNAAFKLNEWLASDYKKMKGTALRLYFLKALAEQEISAKELLV